MPKRVVIEVPHALGSQEARRRIDARMEWALTNCRERGFEVAKGEWTGDRLPFSAAGMGQRFAGHVAVGDRAIGLHLAIPWILAPLLPVLEPLAQTYGRKLLAA